jgi:hypothetical protein
MHVVLIKQGEVMKKRENARSALNFKKPSPRTRNRKNGDEIKYIKIIKNSCKSKKKNILY